MKQLTFKDGYETINLEELKLSLDERLVSTKPLNGITHVELLEKIGDICSVYSPVMNDIYVSNKGPSKTPGVSVLPYIEETKGKGAIEAHVFRRLLTSFEIETDLPEYNVKIAVSFHQNGIDIAMGANVRVCSNLSIFGYDNMISIPRFTVIEAFNMLSHWITNYNKKLVDIDRCFTTLKNTHFSLSNCFEFIGLLTGIRVEKDSPTIKNFLNDSKVYCLNQGQISQFTEKCLLPYSENPKEILVPAYDLYNIGTALQKPNNMELNNIIPQNIEFGMCMLTYIENKFN